MTTVEPDVPPAPPDPDPEEPKMAELRQAIEDSLAAMRLPESGAVTGNAETGEITVAFTTGPVTLPRPIFKQIRVLIRAEQHLAVRLRNVDFRSSGFTTKFRLDMVPLQGDAGPGNIEMTPENVEALERLRNEAREAADLIEDERDDEIAKWWALVFETLTPAGADVYGQDVWPADLIDPSLPARVVQHWRRNPQGPG